jgi:gliding motility-associated-like protein
MSTSTAGRSGSITNINGGSTTALEALLNNVGGPNTSVSYTTIPTPFFCINKPANYNPGAVDPNLDSLTFSLVPGLNGTSGNVTYVTPYTATAPMATATGTYSFSNTNGQIAFTPNATQRALIVSQVNEYRNGVLVGTSMREMTFVVLNTCNNNPPGGTVSSPSTGVATINGTTVAACASLGIISFQINPTDLDGDHINMAYSGLPAGSTFSITGNNGYTPSATFTWNITNVTPGTYNFFVTFTDDGCSLSSKQTLAYTVVVYGNPNPGFTLISAATCTAKAKFSLTPFAGLAPYTVSITGGTVADTFTNVTTVTDSVSPGTYTISTTSSIGCTYDTIITFAPPSNVNVTISTTGPTCVAGANGTITATGVNGVSPYTYAIGTGTFSSTNFFTGLTAGTYAIHVKDAGSCAKDTNVTITDPVPIYVAVGLSKPPCNHFANGSITISGYNSVAPYTYAIGTGTYGSSGTFGGLYSGPYTVHVKNALGCIKDTVVILPDSIKISATVPVAEPLCFGSTNGTILVNASGAYPPYTYAINSGSFGTSNVFTGLGVGTYTIHVLDTALCYFDTTITLSQPTQISVTPTVTNNVTCNGGSNGAISVAASGGTPGYTYSANTNPYGGSSTITGLTAGTYTVNVKDANGCIRSASGVVITEPTPIVVGYTSVQPNCSYSADGSYTLSGSGGTPGYTYSVDGAAYTASGTFTGLAGGGHVLHVKDAAGCIKDSAVILSTPPRIIPSAAVRKSTCATLGDGVVTLNASGGTPGYTYAKGAGTYGASGVFNALAAGSYTFHVKDTHGCIGDTTILITDSLIISGNVTVTDVVCYNQNNGTITVTGTGGGSPYTYALGTGTYGAGGSYSSLPIGPYVLHIKDVNGCIKDTSLNITQPTLLIPAAAVTNILCNGAGTGVVTISASGGSPTYTYAQGSGTYGSSGTFNGLTAGTYTFHVKDSHNCISDTTVTITQPTPIAISAVKTDVLCNGGASGTITITATGGTPGYTYALNAGGYGSSNVIASLSAGTYTVHTKDANGCIKDTTITIGEPTKLAIGYTSVSPLCNGDANGSITIAASGGTPTYRYSLNASPFTVTTSYTGLLAGTYTLHIKDANNCTKDSTINLSEPAPLAFTLAVTNVLCNGDTSGTVTITASGGTAAYTYAIDARPFGSTTVLTGLGVGTHTIHLKDANNCTKDSTITITQPAKLALGYTSTQPLCNGASNGTITISGTGGTVPYSYAINSGSFGPAATFTGLPAGTDTLHIKDANGCSRDSIITLAQPTLLTLTATKTNVLCNGGSTGTVTVTGAGGTTPYTYASDAGSYGGSNVLTGLNAGTHTIHLKDAKGCIKDTTINITEPTALGIGYTSVKPLCNGDANGSITISATGGTLPYLYSLNATPFSGATVYNGLSAGTYTLHIKDGNNCTKDSTITLTEPAALGLTLSVSNVLCNGGNTGTATVAATGGTTAYTYAMDAGSFGSSGAFTGLTAGIHTVHIKDANGCLKDSTFSIIQPSRLNLSYTLTQPLCNGAANGSITVSGIGGTTPYTYAMGTGTFGNSGTFNGLTAGTYTLHVQDANGCVKDSANVILAEPAALSLSLVVTNVLCNGGNSGTATVTAAGGIAPYTYALDAGAFGGSNVLTGLNAGTHTIHLKDVNGCSKDTTITITEPTKLNLTYTSVMPLCNGDANGSITITGTGGTTPYTYSINASPFGASGVFGLLNAGTYVLHVKDAHNCTKDSTITLSQPAALAFTFAVSNVLCNGDTSGSVTVTASGGTTAYSYAVDARPFGTSNVITGLNAGTHTIHLKDGNGCVKDSTITITQPTKLQLGFTFVTPLCNGDANGSITITASGGTTPYQYALNSGSFGSSGVFSGLAAGTDTLHIKDANGCTRDSIFILTQPAKLAYTLVITKVLCNGGSTGTVTVNATGGTAPYTYALDAGPFGTVNVLTGLAVGTYTLHVKDANGCIKDSSINVTQPAVLNIGATVTNVLCSGGNSGTITISGTGGTTPYTYALNAGGFVSTPSFTGLTVGTYVLHLKDVNGCTKDSTVTITEPTAIQVTAAIKRPRCTPLVNGAVTLYPTGGTPGYTFAVGTSPYSSSSTFNNLGSGVYTFHVKDANGCVSDVVIGVFDSVFVHANYTVTNATCYGLNNGSVSIVALGGDLPYTYAINTNPYSATNPITSLLGGSYTLHVKDANGCILDTALIIGQPSVIVPAVSYNEPKCFGTSTGNINIGASGGTPGYTYALGSGAYSTANVFSNLPTGTYTLHVKDANGCIHDTTITMGQPPRLVLDAVNITPVICYGDNTGTATVIGHGGTPGYQYARDAAPYSVSNVITGLYAGVHVIHFQDANGCVKDTTITVTQPPPFRFNASIISPTCEGFKNGSVTIAGTGGTPAYVYAMDPNPYKSTFVFDNLGEGTYLFHVQDNNLCVYDTTIVLNGYPHIDIGVPTVVPPSCFGFSNGVITMNSTGGVDPLTYHMMKPSRTNNTGVFDSLKKGTYTVNITDSKGCTKDTTIIVTEPPLLQVVSKATPNDCLGKDDEGTVTSIVDGGTPPYSYEWSSGQHSDAITGVGNGAYWVTVTDAGGCADSALAVVEYDDCCKPYIPDAFTPNGDGKNDIFRLRWKGDVSKLQFSIYNRFGERVFVSYQADIGWDGMYHGKPADMDVYFYYVKFICGSKGDNHVEYKGDVTLIR